ncbi:MAG: radical SAM protein [Spirochaetes bacterium]|nr:radical SAM protein [Spirochaetota bacterium]
MKVIVNELFHSLQGESSNAGFPSLFIRLAGCNLGCSYCDTDYARTITSGKETSIDELVKTAEKYNNIHHVTITGGEPLLQKNSIMLMKALIEKGFTVQLETNGSISIKDVPQQVIKIVDVKTPSSGHSSSFLHQNLEFMNSRDELKFVILDINDYHFSVDFIKKHLNNKKIIINFSPVYGKISGTELANLILIDKLPVRLNLQLHKILWPDGEPKT